MKKFKNKQFVVTLLCMVFLFGSSSIALAFQEAEAVAPRLSLSFEKNPSGSNILKAKTRVRVERRFQSLPNVPLNFYKVSDSVEVLLGTAMSDADGNAILETTDDIFDGADSSGLVYVEARVESVEGVRNTSTDMEIANSVIDLEFDLTDSTGRVTAFLKNALTKEPIAEEDVTFYLKTSFAPLTIGDDFVSTDEEGKVSVELPADLPAGPDGMVEIGVKLDDHSTFGTVRTEKAVSFGKPSQIKNTFNERSMWGSQAKTPLWLLIFPNLIILGVWGTLIFLAYKLYVIYKN